MTIKVTKPAVNLREELTDLKQPYPIQGSVDGNDAARERLGIENHDQLTIGTDGVVDNFTSTGIDDNADATAITIDVNENVGIGTPSTNSRKFRVYGSGDLVELVSTNAGVGGAQIDLKHESASPADNDSVGIINFAGYDSSSNGVQYANITGKQAV